MAQPFVGYRGVGPGGTAAGDRDFLRVRCGELNEQLQELTYALPAGPIHADAHPRNLLTNNGEVVLLDFEVASIGPRR